MRVWLLLIGGCALAGCPSPSSDVPFGQPDTVPLSRDIGYADMADALDFGDADLADATDVDSVEPCAPEEVEAENCPGASTALECTRLEQPAEWPACRVRHCLDDGHWGSWSVCPPGITAGGRACRVGEGYREPCPHDGSGGAMRYGQCHLDPQTEMPAPSCTPDVDLCVDGQERSCEAPCDPQSTDAGCVDDRRERAMRCVAGVWVPLHACPDVGQTLELPCGPLYTEEDAPRSRVEGTAGGVRIIEACDYDPALECPRYRRWVPASPDLSVPFEIERPCGCNGRGTQRWHCPAGILKPAGACQEPDVCVDGELRVRVEPEGVAVHRCRLGEWVGSDRLHARCDDVCAPCAPDCDCVEVEAGVRVRFVESRADDGFCNGGEVETDCGPPSWLASSCLQCPDQPEVHDGRDDDCDGEIDEDIPAPEFRCSTATCHAEDIEPCPEQR